ncbi:hypothetical protein C3489_28670 [Streptomyces sp. Ru71]|nr:hypothetical protein C3489_28670 [Streptomyces sp. Ru71]
MRALVLLLALLVPGEAFGEAYAPPATPAATASAEHDVTDTAVRPPVQGAHRTAVPPRPAPLPDAPAPARATGPVPRAGVRTPYTALLALRSVVLRC